MLIEYSWKDKEYLMDYYQNCVDIHGGLVKRSTAFNTKEFVQPNRQKIKLNSYRANKLVQKLLEAPVGSLLGIV